MLPPLDTRKLRALLRDEDDDEELECDPRGHISIIKELITEDRNWSDGVLRLLGLWPRIDPRFYRKKPMSTRHPLYDKGGPNNWWIDFHDSFLGSLRLRPSRGGVIDIYAFGKRVQSFQIIGCRRNWPAMILWIWDYGNRIEATKSKQKVSHSHTRVHGQRQRVNKPLLHKVLHTATFKAQHGRVGRAREAAVVPEGTDFEMDDVDSTKPLCNTAPDAASSSGHMGWALQTRGMSDDQRTPSVTTENIDIGALQVVDYNSREDLSPEKGGSRHLRSPDPYDLPFSATHDTFACLRGHDSEAVPC